MTITQELKFPDVSFYQSPINFDLMGNIAIFRMGQNLWIDTQFEQSRNEATARGMIWGGYWFYDDRVSPSAQAQKVYSLFSNDQPRPKMEIFVDWEKSYGGSYSGISNVVAFMQELERLMPWIKLGMYTGYYWFIGNTNTTTHASQLSYLSKKPLWLAWYTSNPDNVLIPRPWTKLDFWQYGTPPEGHLWGVSSIEIDMNWFNGTALDFYNRYLVNVPPPIIEPSEYHTERWYNSTAHIVLVSPFEYDIVATNTNGYLERVSSAATRLGAKVAINADGWSETGGYPHLPYSLAVSNGKKYQTQFDFRPFVNVTKDEVVSIGNLAREFYNTVSGTRYIVQGSTKPTYLFGTEPQYVEKHPRTAIGITSSGKLLLVVVDGRSATDEGVTLSELADIMLEYGCVTAIEMDGGGSSTLWYDGCVRNVPSDGSERYVVNHLVFIKKGVTNVTNYIAKPINKNVAMYSNSNGTGAEVGRLKLGQTAKGSQMSGLWLLCTVVESGITGWLDTRLCTVTQEGTPPPTPTPTYTHIHIELEGHVPFDADIEKLP